jgi:rRNA N6-adenosine-methyltransferase METTL5
LEPKIPKVLSAAKSNILMYISYFYLLLSGADVDFIEAGLLLAKPEGGRIFSLHKTSTRDFLLRRAKKWPGVRAECRAQLRWNLDQSFGFHKKKSLDIDVDLFSFERI